MFYSTDPWELRNKYFYRRKQFFYTVSRFNPSLIFMGMDRCISKWSPFTGHRPSLACKYLERVKVTHTLAYFGTEVQLRTFYSTDS
jgi:hypothetical protein